ncbi:MAG: Uncharacterized protein JWP80_3906 [Pseudomonas sp.]|nr:Uncharacterized protein [Pseudomonas sp.]
MSSTLVPTSNPIAPYFHAGPLKGQFALDVTQAAEDGHIDTTETHWLRSLVDARTEAQSVNPPRLDRILKTGGLPIDLELTAAVMISQPASGDGPVFLSTLLYGLERFGSREHLVTVLGSRFGTRTTEKPTFEEELIEGSLFEHRSSRVIAQQTQKLTERSDHLHQMPTLQSVLSHALQAQVTRSMPESTLDPTTHLLQIIQPSVPAPVNEVAGVQKLADALLDDYCGQALTPGFSRRFLDATGRTLDADTAQRWQKALADAVSGVQAVFETRLGNFWWSPVGHGQTRREYFADALAESFRRELFTCRHELSLDAQEFRRLTFLLDKSHARWGEGGQVQVKKLVVTFDQHPPTNLAGMFVIERLAANLPELLLYSAHKGLRRFRSRLALEDYFATVEGGVELRHCLALEDHARQQSAATFGLVLEDIGEGLFLERMDSIIALQKSNLLFALAQPRREGNQAGVMIDDALDVRSLIDTRLVRLTGGGRWRDTPGAFEALWLKPPVIQPPEQPTASEPSWLDLALELEEDARAVWQVHPDAMNCARNVLNGELAVLGEGLLDAREVRITWGTPQVNMGLIAMLLERVSGHRVIDLPLDAHLVISSAGAKPSVTFLTPTLVDRLLQHAEQQFSSSLTAQTQAFAEQPLRLPDSQLQPGPDLSDITAGLLRVELSLDGRFDRMDSDTRVMLQQVLNFPLRDLREHCGTDRVEVYSLSLKYDARQPPVIISNLFVMQQPSHATTPEHVTFWSPFLGIWAFDSLTELKRTLIARLRQPRERGRWLTLLSEPERSHIDRLLTQSEPALSIVTTRLDGHFIELLRRPEEARQRQGIEHSLAFAQRCRVEASLFNNLISEAQRDDRVGTMLDALISALQNSIFEAQLPQWMKEAPLTDLWQYVNILKRFYASSDPERDFLFDIPLLRDFARKQVLGQLRLDFPDQTFDPDTLMITLTRFTGTPVGTGQTPSFLPAATEVSSETLTDYALNHFSTIQGASLAVSGTGDTAILSLLTPAYVRELIHKVDVGTHFQALLSEKFDSTHPEYSLRRQYFFQQWPTLMLERGFQQKLQKKLSATAFDYLASLMEMPDGLARQAVDDEDIVLLPLELIAQPGASTDTIPGYYVIAPKDVTQGPVILHAIFNQDFCFKEYVDRAALEHDLRTSTTLQTQIMQRVAPEVQARYGHRSFLLPPVWTTEFYTDFPMFPLGPVSLGNVSVRGNVLQYSFEDTISVFKAMAKTQTVTTAQADWESFTYLMTLQAEQVLMFMPGEVGLMVAGWQGLTLVQASVSSAMRRRWGQALSEFTAALAMLASAKQAAREEELFDELVDLTADETSAPPEFSWRNAQVPAEIKVRLQAFEASDIALSNLLKDELFNLYQDPLTSKRYAAVAGKVYQVVQEQGTWSIISADKKGPQIKLNDHQQWELDLRWGLRGGGALLTRQAPSGSLSVSQINAEIDKVFTVLATGMSAIRLSYRDQARRIGQAHLHAKRYLENSLDNLNVRSPTLALDTRTVAVIEAFFGVTTPSAALVGAIKHSMSRLFSALMDASLAPFSSRRFVVGLNKAGHDLTVGFTAKADPLQRIFLSERFFQAPTYKIKPRILRTRAFNRNAHFRAVALLHELSHLSNDTFDIAYLEAHAPFLDLMADDTADLSRIKADVEEIQQRYFSHQTHSNQLFQHFRHGRWRDLASNDPAEGKQLVLSITGQTTLAAARPVFLNNAEKRSELILRNADSLALLITLLGRERFVPALPEPAPPEPVAPEPLVPEPAVPELPAVEAVQIV